MTLIYLTHHQHWAPNHFNEVIEESILFTSTPLGSFHIKSPLVPCANEQVGASGCDNICPVCKVAEAGVTESTGRAEKRKK